MLKKYPPTTSGRRKMTVSDYSLLSKEKPPKYLVKILKKSAGRDKSGQISVRHRGGGEKRKYRILSSLDKKMDMKAKIQTVEYDPNRSAFIALVKFADNNSSYILAWEGAKAGQEVVGAEKTEIKSGNRLKLKNIPNGISIYDLELHPGQGGVLVRSAGTAASIVAKEGKWAHVKLPSGETRKININSFASIGQVSNLSHGFQRIGKAGRNRHLGIRPTVRGKAMHPAAHPHGGGEGVNPIGLKYPKTPWGKHALGVRTRKKNKYSRRLIIQRRKK